MENAAIRQKLYEYIGSVDDNKLQAMYIIPQTDMERSHDYSEAVMTMLHQRRDNHVKGSSPSYTVEEALAFARSRRK